VLQDSKLLIERIAAYTEWSPGWLAQTLPFFDRQFDKKIWGVVRPSA